MKGILKAMVTTAVCAAVFFLTAFVYLNANQKSQKAEAKEENIPYSESVPDNCGVLTEFPDETGCVIYFDFANSSITSLFCDDVNEIGKEYKGYSVDYNLKADYPLLSGIIDRSGGINLDIKDGLLRYTGIQITDILSTIGDPTNIRSIIAKAIFKSISENGITTDDMVYIIENSETDLSVPICLSWPEYLKDMCRNSTVIN